MSSKDAENTDATKQLIESGAEIAGASVGAAIGLIGGPPGALGGAAAGVAATRVLRRLGAEVQERWMAPRQRVRAGAAFAVAADAIASRLQAGQVPREDGFFAEVEDGRGPAGELLEGVLMAAADAYEERKVPFLGQLYAAFVFNSDVSRAHANYFIALSERLTFRQLSLLAVLWEGDVTPLAAKAANRTPPEQLGFNDQLGVEVDELERLGLVGRGEPGGTPQRGGATFVDASGVGPAGLTLTGPGKRLYELMHLNNIPGVARQEVLADVATVTTGPS